MTSIQIHAPNDTNWIWPGRNTFRGLSLVSIIPQSLCFGTLGATSTAMRCNGAHPIALTNLPDWGQAAEIASPDYISTLGNCT